MAEHATTVSTVTSVRTPDGDRANRGLIRALAGVQA